MITLLNRKKLLTDTSQEEITRIRDILKQNRIQCEIVTQRSQSALGMSMRGNAGVKIGHGSSTVVDYAVGPLQFVYHLYVRRRDYEQARQLMGV